MTNRRNKTKQRGPKKGNRNLLIAMPPPAFPGQLRTTEVVVGTNHQFISAGASPYTASINLALQPSTDVPSWADFVAKYQLYRVIKFIAIYNDYLNYAGFAYWWFSDNAAASTLAIALQQRARQVNLHRIELVNKIKYTSNQLDLLAFVATNANITNPPTLNMVSDNTVNNTTGSTQALGQLVVRYVIQFIGSA